MLSVFTWGVECSLCSFVAACAGSHRGCAHKGPSLRCPRAPLSAPQCPSVLPDSPLTLGLRHHTATYWVPLASNHRREPRLWHQEETYILMSFSNLPESLHTYLVYLTPPFFSINYSSTQDKALTHPNSSKSWTAGVPRKLLSGFIPIEGLMGGTLEYLPFSFWHWMGEGRGRGMIKNILYARFDMRFFIGSITSTHFITKTSAILLYLMCLFLESVECRRRFLEPVHVGDLARARGGSRKTSSLPFRQLLGTFSTKPPWIKMFF